MLQAQPALLTFKQWHQSKTADIYLPTPQALAMAYLDGSSTVAQIQARMLVRAGQGRKAARS